MFRWRSVVTKATLGAVVAAFVIWLAFTPSGNEQRFATLEELFRSQRLAKISNEDAEAFSSLVNQAVATARIRDPIVINSPPVRGHLNFFVTDPQAQWFTHCSEGNAVYDADLDAVFIDHSLFRTIELPKIGRASFFEQLAPREFPFSRTFLNLIMLHELGHRQLHRSGGGFFDNKWADTAMRKEVEADDFAVQVLKRAYAEGEITTDSSVLAEIEETGVGKDLRPEQQLVAALLYASSQMSIALLFSRGSFSSLYEDPAHPRFGERVRRISQSLANLAGEDETLRAYLDYFKTVSERVDELRKRKLLEVHCENPVAGVAFDDDGLVILDRSWNIWRVPSAEMRKSRRDHSAPIRPRRIGQIPSKDTEDNVEGLWSLRDGGVFLASRGEVFQVRESNITARPDIATTLKASASAITVTVPAEEPTEVVVRDVDSSLTFLRGERVTGSIPWADVLATAKASGLVTEPTIKHVMQVGNELQAAILERAGPLVGQIRINASPPFDPRFIPLRVSDDIDSYGELVSVQPGDHPRYFLFGKVELLSKISVWELFEDRPPTLRTSYEPLLYHLSELPFSGQNVPVVVTRVRIISPNLILITLAADSILLYNVQSNTLEPVFHPGTSVNISIAQNGLVAFSAFNGYKAFLFQSDSGE